MRRYKVAASLAYAQWQKAIRRSEKESPHKNKGFKQAQALSWKRSLLAHELMGSIHQHVAALALEKVDTLKLYQQALQVDYLNKYRAETREPFKLHMANQINNHLKDFQAGLAVYGLYEEIKERAAHFSYLERIKKAPDVEMKAIIRLALDYQDKKVKAAVMWGQVKALKHLKIDASGLSLQAKQLMRQRNSAAHALLQACTQKERLTKELTGIKLEHGKLEREASQHLAQQLINRYQSSEDATKGQLAKELLANKAHYHLLYDNNLSFEVLTKEAKQFEQELSFSHEVKGVESLKEKPSKPLWDIERITQALMNNPIETYTAILGEPKERASNHLRYSGGLIISTKGSDAGKWYSFTEEVGGTPLSAIQKFLHLSFQEALAYGASLAGLSDYEAKKSEIKLKPIYHEPKPIDKLAELKINNGITSAQSIWNGTIEAQGSLAERYFKEHRKIDNIEAMAIRYWPKGAVWVDFDSEGKPVEKPNKIPAAVIAAYNTKGDVVSVQRIYLDEKTASKNTFLKEAKLTKGSNKGSPGIIQLGTKAEVLYIAEGPETAASIASLDKEATVLVSFSVSNIANMAEVIKTYAPKQVIIAADNDGEDSASRKTSEKACQALRDKGIDARIVYPNPLPNKTKTDWNDILVVQGKEALYSQFQEKVSQTKMLYEQGMPAIKTLAENYFKTPKDSIDLSDVRFLASIPYKGQSVPAFMLPKTDSQGLLCGQAVFALSQDGSQIINEGKSRDLEDGFYIANKGKGDTLIIADTPLNAKKIAADFPHATVILSRVEDYLKLYSYTEAQGKSPTKVMVLSEDKDRDQQMLVASSLQNFLAQGVDLFLMNAKDNSTMKLDPIALEKSRLKASFEKLLSQKPAEISKPGSAQELFNALKKDYPLLEEYEQASKQRKKAQGYLAEQQDKKLLALAQEIAKDKKLVSKLERDIPQVALDVKKRIKAVQERGVRR